MLEDPVFAGTVALVALSLFLGWAGAKTLRDGLPYTRGKRISGPEAVGLGVLLLIAAVVVAVFGVRWTVGR